MRHPVAGFHSIEGVFRTVHEHLQAPIESTTVELPHISRRIGPRILNLLSAFWWKFDVYHITGDVHYLAMVLPGKKTVLTIHDVRNLVESTGIRKKIIEIVWFRVPLMRAGVVTTGSEFSRGQLLNLFPRYAKKIEVVEHALSDAYFSSQITMSDDPATFFQCASRRVLVVGTKDNKNCLRIFKALVGLDVELTIVGHLSPPQVNALNVCNLSYSNVEDVSAQEIIELYRSSALLVFPSLYEGFGLPIIEAQALGIPVVTSDREPMRSVAGMGALLVDPESVEQIREAVKLAIWDVETRARLILDGIINTERFQASEIAARYASIYARIHAGA